MQRALRAKPDMKTLLEAVLSRIDLGQLGGFLPLSHGFTPMGEVTGSLAGARWSKKPSLTDRWWILARSWNMCLQEASPGFFIW